MQLQPITRSSSIMALLLLILIVAATMLRYALHPYGVEVAESCYGDGVWARVVAALLFITTGMMVGRLGSMSGMLKVGCTLPIPLFGIVGCSVMLAPHIFEAALAAFLTALGLLLLLRSLIVVGEKNSLFFGAMSLGCAALAYPPCVVLVAVVVVSIPIFTLSVRQSIIALTGWLLPLFVCSYALWYAGSDFGMLARNMADVLLMPRPTIARLPYMAIAQVVLLALVVVVGMAVPSTHGAGSMLVRTRRAIWFFVLTTLITLAAYLFSGCGAAMLPVIAVPLSLLISLALCRLRDTVSAIIYWFILLISIVHLFVE